MPSAWHDREHRVGEGGHHLLAAVEEPRVGGSDHRQGRSVDRAQLLPDRLLDARTHPSEAHRQACRAVGQPAGDAGLSKRGEHRLGEPATKEGLKVALGLDLVCQCLVAHAPLRPEHRVGEAWAGSDEHHPAQARWALERQGQGQSGAERVAEQVVGLAFGGLVDEHRGLVEVRLELGRAAVPGQVHRDDAVLVTEQLSEGPPGRAGLGEAVACHDEGSRTPARTSERGHRR